MRRIVLLVVSGCGRVGFDERVCEDDCLSLSVQLATWEQARDACLERGPTSHLATISSADENVAASAFAATIPFDATQTNTNQRQRMWIGGSLGSAGAWQWDTGEPFEFMNWRAGEPDQLSEKCLIMLGSEQGQWDNRSCSTPLDAFLCEDD